MGTLRCVFEQMDGQHEQVFKEDDGSSFNITAEKLHYLTSRNSGAIEEQAEADQLVLRLLATMKCVKQAMQPCMVAVGEWGNPWWRKFLDQHKNSAGAERLDTEAVDKEDQFADALETEQGDPREHVHGVYRSVKENCRSEDAVLSPFNIFDDHAYAQLMSVKSQLPADEYINKILTDMVHCLIYVYKRTVLNDC